jgi:hypothetical protein
LVLETDQNVPATAKKLGSLKVVDGGFTMKCDYQTVLEKAKIEVQKAGGNLLKITKHTMPGIISSCHQIAADIYYVSTADENEMLTSKKQIDSLPLKTKELSKNTIIKPFRKFRISTSGGLSFLLAKTSDQVPADFRQYVKELKSGSHYSIDGGYFWKENIGLGLKYSSFYTKNSIENITVTDMNGQTRTGRLADDINTQFFGAMLYTREYSKSRNIVWFANASLGYIDYNNKATVIDNILITGGTFGGSLDLGVDFKLVKNFYFGFDLGYTAGVLTQLNYNNGIVVESKKLEKGQYESMNRLDLSAGLRYAW